MTALLGRVRAVEVTWLPVGLCACVPVNVSTPNFHPSHPSQDQISSLLPHLSSVWVFSFEQKKTARLSSLAFLFPFFSLLSSLRLCAPACAPRLISLCCAVVATRNTAQRLDTTSPSAAHSYFQFARGFIAARCLSAFDSRYRSWFGRLHLSPALAIARTSSRRTSTLEPRADLTHTHIPTHNSPSCAIHFLTVHV